MENAYSVKKISIKDMVLAGMFAAFLAIMSQISLPMPTGVPITIQVFAVALVGVVLGWKLGVVSVVIYILLGAVGLPVFAGFKGGLGAITGVTGGYIIAWPAFVFLSGLRTKFESKALNLAANLGLSLLGLIIIETVGGLQWALLSGTEIKAIAVYSMTAFVPKDAILTVLAVIVGRQARKRISILYNE